MEYEKRTNEIIMNEVTERKEVKVWQDFEMI